MHFARESIFVGAVRSFCTGLAGLLGVFVAVVIGVVIFSLFSKTELASPLTETTIAADAEGNRSVLPLTAPAILRINLHGVIGDNKLDGAGIEDILTDSRHNLLAHDRVKGILLHVNTPGGTATDADDIYRSLMAYKKKYSVPVYAYVDGLCASGGVLVTSICDKIFASPPSTIGSVGVVFGPTFNIAQAMDKVGVHSTTLTAGKDKDMFNPFRPWIPGEDNSVRNIVNALYQRFVNIVIAGRPKIDRQKLIETYGAQVYIADEAEKIGFVDDGNSSYETALRALTQAAGIGENQHYQVVQLDKPDNLVRQIFGNNSLFKGKITHRFDIGPYMTSDMSGKFLYLYQP